MRLFFYGNYLSLAKRVRFCLFLIIFAVMIGDALAGAEPTELDQFSSYQLLGVQGHDVVLQDKIRMPNGNWDSLRNSDLNNKEGQKQRQASPLNCSVPLQTLKDFSLNKIGVAAGSPPDASTLYCDTDKIWFASRAYCGEGDDSNNESGQAYLHSFDIHTGKVTTYQNFIPRCVSISSLVRIGSEMWATTYFQGEYERGGGSGVLALDISTGTAKEAPREVITHKFTGSFLSSIVYQEESGYVWISTSGGIDRYSVKDRKWEQHYFDIKITPDNKLQLVLSANQPSKKKLWLAYQLYFYPIDDLNGFASAWQKIELFGKDGRMKYDIPVVHGSLLPYYISALMNMDTRWNDYEFIGLLNVIAAYQDGGEQIKPLVKRLLAEPMSSERRSAVVQVANKFGMSNSVQLMDEQFDSLLTGYFINHGRANGNDYLRMCEFAFHNVRYISTLNDYYIAHEISNADTDRDFLYGCVRAYSMWQGYSALLPTVLKVLNQNKDIENLAAMCSIFNHYVNPDYRQPRFVFPIINARYKTDRFKNDRKFLSSCVPASYWITNSAENIDELLNGIDAYPDLIPMAIDVLHELTGMKFDSIPEWRNWWKSNRKLYRPSKKVFYIG